MEIEIFAGHLERALPVVAAAALRLSSANPIGRAITTAAETIPLDKAFQQAKAVAVLGLPVAAEPGRGQSQEMGSQMRHPHPGQHQKTHRIGQEMKGAFPAGLAPANELIAWGALPGGRAKDQTRQRPARPIPSQILEIFSDRTAITQVMMLLEQLGQLPSLHRGLDRRQLHRAHLAQRPLQEWLGPPSQLLGRGRLGRAAAPAALPAGKLEQTPTLQFKEQRPGGHILDLSGAVAPVPLLGEMEREPKAAPVGMGADQLPDSIDLFGPEATTLNA